MIKAKSLHPKKYRVGTWSKANMKWTRAEDLAASLKRLKEEAVLKEETEKELSGTLGEERLDEQGAIDNDREGTDTQRSIDWIKNSTLGIPIDEGPQWIDMRCDGQRVSEDASA